MSTLTAGWKKRNTNTGFKHIHLPGDTAGTTCGIGYRKINPVISIVSEIVRRILLCRKVVVGKIIQSPLPFYSTRCRVLKFYIHGWTTYSSVIRYKTFQIGQVVYYHLFCYCFFTSSKSVGQFYRVSTGFSIGMVYFGPPVVGGAITKLPITAAGRCIAFTFKKRIPCFT